jgi:hypothetical protein
MFDINTIKKEIKENPICFVYKIHNNKAKLIIKTYGKNDAKNELKDYKNRTNSYFIIAKIFFHSGQKFGQKGPISVLFNAYIFIDDKLKNIANINDYPNIRDNMIGPVWFDKIFLEKKGWNNNYIDTIIEKLITGKKKIIPLNIYNVHFSK